MSTPAFVPHAQLHPIRLRAAMATPSFWRDATITSVDSDGVISATDLDGNLHVLRVAAEAAVGEPVAIHGVYSVIAIGGGYRALLPLV
jgi:hypothetical protein